MGEKKSQTLAPVGLVLGYTFDTPDMISVLRLVGVLLEVLLLGSVNCLIAVSATGSSLMEDGEPPDKKSLSLSILSSMYFLEITTTTLKNTICFMDTSTQRRYTADFSRAENLQHLQEQQSG